jgi:GT2 family glycosyltransferase
LAPTRSPHPEEESNNTVSLVSVVIPNLNGEHTLGHQLEALSRQTYRGPWEVVVADNGSIDRSRSVVETWSSRLPALRWVDASDKKGFSHASNTGAWAASGDFLAFCDNDDIVDPRWLEVMVEAAEEFNIVGGWLDDETLNDATTRGWRTPLPRDRLPRAFGFLPFVVAGNCGVRAEIFRELGGWNEEYLLGCQDVEFSWRAHLAGHELGVAPEAVVHYRYRTGLRALGRQYYSWGREEARLYKDFRKHGFSRSNTRGALLEWLWLAIHVFDLRRSPSRRGAWMRKAANRWGRLRGSIRHRVLFL